MGIREKYGQMLEDALNAGVDKYLDAGFLKERLNEELNKFIDDRLEDLKHKIKADVIDRIDGEDDIPSE